jgi:hypothetical protein
MDFTKIIFIFFLLGTLYFFIQYRSTSSEFFQPQTQFQTLSLKPTLWWIVDDETNARSWWDFGARNSHVPNKGYLKVALECLDKTQGGDFTIQPLLGRKAVSAVIASSGGNIPDKIESVPIAIWRQWAISNLLALKGGLAMMGDSTLCVGPSFAKTVSGGNAYTFGIYPGEASSLPGSEMVGPAPWVSWSAGANHPGWMFAAEQWNRILNAGPTAWTAAEARRENLNIWMKQKELGVQVLQEPEGSRNPDGSERTLEDLFGREAEPVDPKTILLPNTVYIPFDGDSLVRTYRYSWFVRMSKEQIMESNFVWAKLAKNILS